MKKIILASGSPRRHELLESLGIGHIVMPCNEDEEDFKKSVKNQINDLNKEYKTEVEKKLIELAYQKVKCVEKNLLMDEKKNAIIIGADTVVIFQGELIGKPKSKNDAIEMLKKIMGNTHEVFTSLCLLDVNTNTILTTIEKTKVSMVKWSIEQIKSYIESENVFDKAGAYAIQGKGSAMIDRIEGCFYNVMGLPISRLIALLNKLGYKFLMA